MTAPRTRRAWTLDEDRALRRLWEAGTMIKIISHELARAKASIYTRVKFLGLSRRNAIRAETEVIVVGASIPKSLHAKLISLAAGRGMATSAYIRLVLRNHVGNL